MVLSSIGLTRMAFDHSEGVVKRHLFSAMLCSTARISEWWRIEALKTPTVNHSAL
jgi:hypothetical protein